jgi:oligosaccharide repeat unit polymerase
MIRIDKTYWLVYMIFILGSFIFSFISNINFIGFGSIFIFLLTGFLLSFFTIIINIPFKDNNNKLVIKNPNLPTLNKVIILSNIITLIYFFLFIRLNSDTFEITKIPAEIAFRRYTDSLLMPFYLKILRFSLTIGSILGAIELAKTKSRPALLAILLVFFDGIMSSGKAGPLQGVIYFYYTFIGVRLLYYNKKINFGFKKLLIIIFVGIIFLVITQAGRIGKIDEDTIYFILRRLFNYAFGGVNAFDIWLQSHTWTESFSFGSETFGGIFDLLGIVERKQGVFQEGVRLGNQPPTNIFTGFRHLIQDYSYGAFIFITLVLSILGHKSINQIKSGNISWIFIFTLIQTYITWIFFSSMFSYNTYIISIFICYLILLLKTRSFRFKY